MREHSQAIESGARFDFSREGYAFSLYFPRQTETAPRRILPER
jgi:hypothetical protein